MIAKSVIASNSKTGEQRVFSGITAILAVITAYAEEHNDYLSTTYMDRYVHQVSYSGPIINLGDWSAVMY